MNTVIFLKQVRKILRFWAVGPDRKYLEELRLNEVKRLVDHGYISGKSILEFGAGAGYQARYLNELGFEVNAIDISGSSHREFRVFDITLYDGSSIPFPNDTFDVVFSSNVFEHIPDVTHALEEVFRVTKPGGSAVILVPSSSWRFFTIITDLLYNFKVCRPHGAHAKNVLSEIFYFSKRRWVHEIKKTRWEISKISTNSLFYTGNNVFGHRINFKFRQLLSCLFGSSCIVLIINKVV